MRGDHRRERLRRGRRRAHGSAGGHGARRGHGPRRGASAGDDDEGEGATRVFAEGAGPGGAGDEWTVNVTDEDQRTLSASQIVVEYQRGVVNDDTYVWKDGMADWLPLSDVPELMRMLSVGASPRARPPRPAARMARRPRGRAARWPTRRPPAYQAPRPRRRRPAPMGATPAPSAAP